MRIAALQYDIVWENPSANFSRLEPWIESAAAAGARLLVLPEMFACGFSMSTERVAEPPDGPSGRFLRAMAKRHGLWITGSLPERPEDGAKPYNTLLLAGPGGEVHRYRKIHPFTHAGEAEHYQAGEDFVTVEIEGLRYTLFICYDLRFADEFWVTAEQTDVYLVTASWPETRRRHWRALLEARAIENQAYVVGVNRVGEGGGLRYAGDSRVFDPLGRMLAGAEERESLLLADLDAALVAQVRRDLPFLQDRR